jgi:hypothetical protein
MKHTYGYFFVTALIGLLSGMLHSCAPGQDHTSAIIIVDSLAQVVEKQLVQMDEASVLNERPIDSANIRIQYLQQNFVGVMQKEMALELSAYASTYRAEVFMKDQLDSLHMQSNSVLSDLKALKQALSEKATHDKNNNEINADYVTKAMAQQMQNVAALQEEVKETMKQEEMLRTKLTMRAPKIQHWMDSITTKNLK